MTSVWSPILYPEMARARLTASVGIILNHLFIHPVGIILILCLVLLVSGRVGSGLYLEMARSHSTASVGIILIHLLGYSLKQRHVH